MSPPFTSDRRLHDRFVLRQRIGPGGMSEVWRADDDVLHRPVVAKALADRLTRGPLAWPDAVRLGGEVAAALAAAHRIGVVHRDVKPGNVMFTDTGVKASPAVGCVGARHARPRRWA